MSRKTSFKRVIDELTRAHGTPDTTDSVGSLLVIFGISTVYVQLIFVGTAYTIDRLSEVVIYLAFPFLVVLLITALGMTRYIRRQLYDGD